MLHAGRGLTEIQTEDLKKLLAAVHRASLRCPLDITELTRAGLQHCASFLLGALRGLDAAGVRAVLVCVLAERASRDAASTPDQS